MSATLPRRIAATMVIAIALIATAYADDKRPMTLEDVARLRSVGAAVISPDGKHIAYTLEIPRDLTSEENGGQWTELHVIGPDGASRPYVTGQANVRSVAWAGNSESVSFITKREGDDDSSLYVIDLAGGEARRVLAFDGGIGSYTWRAGGREVAFVSGGPKPEERKKLEAKGFNAEIFEEDRLPPLLWLASLDTPGAKPQRISVAGTPSDPQFSPDGSKLAVALAPTPHVDDALMRRVWNVVDPSSGASLTRFDTPGKIGPLAWSPDGSTVAFIATNTIHDPAPGRLFLAAAEGGPLENLVPDFEGHIRTMSWAGKTKLVFLADRGVQTEIGSLDLGTEPPERAAAIEWHRTDPAVVFSLSVSDDGAAMAFVGNTPEHPDEVYAAGEDGTPRRLTTTNPWLEGISLAKQEVVEYVARDGLELQGLLLRPLGEQADTRYPLVMVVHGGPESHYRNGWVTWYASGGQALAARGFAVFYPNYRASTGRGVAFSMADHGDPGGKEFDDLVDGVEHLVSAGLVDREKVGVTGGSYGGFASAWCATALTEHFAAAVMSVGISDQVSFAGTTDIPDEMTLVHYRVRPWEDWDLYRERSPIYHSPKARTPILIMHGKEDTRVHPSQSLELYRYLKVLDKTPVRLVLYPGEGHGNRKAAARLDYSMRMVRWMEHYLTGPGGDPPPYPLDYGEHGK